MRNPAIAIRRLYAASLFCIRVLLGASLALTTASTANAQSTEQSIAQTYKSVRANKPNAQNDLANLIVLLRKYTTMAVMADQSELIEALRDMGDARGASSPAIKSYLKEVVPLALIDFIGSRADGRVRGQALLSLRSFEPSDEILDQAITIARADTSADRDFVHQQAEILAKWKQDRQSGTVMAEEKKRVDPAAQKKALDYLRTRKLEVSYYTLREAVGELDPQLIDMLADAGLEFTGVHTPAAYQYVTLGLHSACSGGEATPDKISDVFKALQKHGFKMDTRDDYGNELVMSTMQLCPAPILARLVDLGARPNPVNKQKATPLTYAFVAGQWDVAKALIDRGAGMTKEEVDTTFMELPEDPQQKELVNRALQNAAK